MKLFKTLLKHLIKPNEYVWITDGVRYYEIELYYDKQQSVYIIVYVNTIYDLHLSSFTFKIHESTMNKFWYKTKS